MAKVLFGFLMLLCIPLFAQLANPEQSILTTELNFSEVSFSPIAKSASCCHLEKSVEDLSRCDYWVYLPASLLSILILIWIAPNIIGAGYRKDYIGRPNLLSFDYYLHSIKTPNDVNALIWISGILFFIWLGALVVSLLFETKYKDIISDFVAIQASTLALLFPLIILILDKKEESFLNIVSAKEVLLHYAWAFPSSLALPLLSTYYMFDGSKIWALIITVISVGIALFVLYRLLKITFSIKTWKDEESNLLSKQVQRITADELSDRVAQNSMKTALSEFSPYIEFREYFFSGLMRDKNLYELTEVLATKSGVIQAIQRSKLKKVYDCLEFYSNSKEVEKVSKFILIVSPGMTLEKDKSVIGYLMVRSGDNLQHCKSRIQGTLKTGIKIIRGSSNNVPLEALFSRLGQAGRSAVEKNNAETIDSLKDTYVFIYNQVADTLKRHEAHIKATQKNSYSSPIELIDMRLRKLTRDAFLFKVIDEQVLRSVCYLPYALSVNAIKQKDYGSFNKFVSIASLQSYLHSAESDENTWHNTSGWLQLLLKYELRVAGVGDSKSNENLINYLILNPIAREFQNLMRAAIDAKNLEVVRTAYDEYSEGLQKFRFENFDNEIRIKKTTLKYSNDNEKKEIERKLKILESKQAVKDELKYYSWTALVALCAYCIYSLEEKEGFNTQNDICDAVLRNFLSLLPTNFLDIFKFYVYFERNSASNIWNWSLWQSHHKTGHVSESSTEEKLARIFSFLFARSAEKSIKISVSEMKIELMEVVGLESTGTIRKKIDNPGWTERRLELDRIDNDQKKNLYDIFDNIVHEAKLQDNLRLTELEILPELVRKFKQDFSEGYKIASFFESKMKSVFEGTKNNRLFKYFGLKKLETRELFVQQTRVSFGNMGGNIGEDFARQQDQHLLKEIEEKMLTANKLNSLQQVLEHLKSKRLPYSNYIIVGNIDLLESEFSQYPDFVPKHKMSTMSEEEINLFGVLVVQGSEIKVFQTFLNDRQIRNKIFVMNTSAIRVYKFKKYDNDSDEDPCLNDIGWNIEISDPLKNDFLKKELLAENYSFLSGYDVATREKLVGTKVVLEMFTEINIFIENDNAVFTAETERIEKTTEVE